MDLKAYFTLKKSVPTNIDQLNYLFLIESELLMPILKNFVVNNYNEEYIQFLSKPYNSPFYNQIDLINLKVMKILEFEEIYLNMNKHYYNLTKGVMKNFTPMFPEEKESNLDILDYTTLIEYIQYAQKNEVMG